MRPFDDAERAALAAGGRAAWGRVCEQLAPRLQLLCRLRLDERLARRVDASDLAQHVLSQLVVARPDPGPDGAALLGWMRHAVEHGVIDVHRRHVQAARRSLEREASLDGVRHPAASDGSPTRAARRNERLQALHCALGRMRPAHRDVLVLRLLEGLSVQAVADRMGRSPGAVSVLQHRALCRLRELYVGPEPTGAGP